MSIQGNATFQIKILTQTFATIFFVCLFGWTATAEEGKPFDSERPNRLPAFFDGRPILAETGCFWNYSELTPEATRRFPDDVLPSGAFDSLYLTLRGFEHIVDNERLRDATKEAVEYVRERYGVGTLLDIDVRIARKDFAEKYPRLLQEQLLLQEAAIIPGLEIGLETSNRTDHYTGNYPYSVEGNRLVRAWIYQKNDSGEIIPETIKDVADQVRWKSTNNAAGVASLPESFDVGESTFLCVAVAFAYLYPDLFADETLAMERKIYEFYGDVPAAGIGKDEWGFPPSFNRRDDLNDYWYSEATAAAYAKATGGRSLVDDFFLTFRPQVGKNDERIRCFDDFHRLCLNRVLAYEEQNYRVAKKLWGENAFIGVHGTWYPWPNNLEFRKNGLMWWRMPRDYAQSDEYVPFCCRNSMAKATRSTWINMFYATQVPPYLYEHWTAALAAGRVHIHGIYPTTPESPRHSVNARMLPIVEGGAGRIRSKIRLLNLITDSPMDSTVGVVFGHFGAMNPLRAEYKQVGVELCDRFATLGYPADLIPSDEIRSIDVHGTPRWSSNRDGFLQYGAQAYRYLLFYGENDSDRADFESLRTLAGENGRTKIVELPVVASDEDAERFEQLAASIVENLQSENVPGQTPWEKERYQFERNSNEVSVRPPLNGSVRLIDGTWIRISAANNILGDDLELTNEPILAADGRVLGRVSVRCNGLFACRFDESGRLTALVAADLQTFEGGGLRFDLTDRASGETCDVALLRSESGEWKGVFQAEVNDLPESLKTATDDWSFLARVPELR